MALETASNLTQAMLALPTEQVGTLPSQEQSLTASNADVDTSKTADAPATGQETTGTPSGTATHTDDPAGDNGDTSLTKDATGQEGDGKKTPTHVPYEEFSARNNALQATIAERERELEAVRLGCADVKEFEILDAQAKILTNPMTGARLSGLKEYREVEKQLAAEQKHTEQINAKLADKRKEYIEDLGEELGNWKADQEAVTMRLQADLQSLRMQQGVTTINGEIEKLEGEYKDAGFKLPPNVKKLLEQTRPDRAKELIDGLRESLSGVVMTPTQRKAADDKAVQEYNAQKAADAARAGAAAQVSGGRADTPQGRDSREVARNTGMSSLLGIFNRA